MKFMVGLFGHEKIVGVYCSLLLFLVAWDESQDWRERR